MQGLKFLVILSVNLQSTVNIIFHEVADLSGRSSFCNILILISEMYDFDINRNHGVILSNIIKNFCNMYFRRSCQESKLKILKLSV